MNDSQNRQNEILASIELDDARRVPLVRASNVAEILARSATDPAQLVERVLADPLAFPPLSAATVPGDRVAIAVGDNIPQVGHIVCGAVASLHRSGIDADSIAIVATSEQCAVKLRQTLGDTVPAAPQVLVHDSADKDNLCLVGLDKKHRPLVVNRTIFDADIVLPIGCSSAEGGAYDSLFPAFSNAEAIDEYRTPANVSSPEEIAKKRKQADEAGWQIGVLMSMQVVPGAQESIACIVAGEPQAVTNECGNLYRRLWTFRSPRQASLVIANISGEASKQSWQNVGRALAVSELLLAEGGAIVICSSLEQPPGESLSRLIGSPDLEKAERKIFHDHAADSISAWHVARALQRGPVYFLSRLDHDEVEELGFAPIDSIDELSRLAGRHESCAIIDDSQRAIVTVEE